MPQIVQWILDYMLVLNIRWLYSCNLAPSDLKSLQWPFLIELEVDPSRQVITTYVLFIWFSDSPWTYRYVLSSVRKYYLWLFCHFTTVYWAYICPCNKYFNPNPVLSKFRRSRRAEAKWTAVNPCLLRDRKPPEWIPTGMMRLQKEQRLLLFIPGLENSTCWDSASLPWITWTEPCCWIYFLFLSPSIRFFFYCWHFDCIALSTLMLLFGIVVIESIYRSTKMLISSWNLCECF